MTLKTLCFAFMAALSGLATATPTTYTFTTGAISGSGNSQLVALLGASPKASGQFNYDPQAAFYGSSGDLGFGGNSAIYLGSPAALAFSGLSGSVAGLWFSDPYGTVSIGNDQLATPGTPRDSILISADPSPKAGSNTTPAEYPRQLSTVDIGDYRLSNVRLFWTQSANGAADFLTDTTMPAQLPAYAGGLALDFIRISDPGNLANVPYFANTVFFSGLLVQTAAVPEPDQWLLSLLGMGLITGTMALKRRR